MTPHKPTHQIDYSAFVKFHPSANGTSGRPVFIDPQLLPRFMEIVDLDKHDGLEVARGLIGLKNSAAGNSSDSNRSNAFQHRLTIHNVAATYTVLQSGGRGAGVYITDLQHGYSRDQGRPGLYKAEPSYDGESRWKAVPDESAVMPSLVGVLGALPPSGDGTGSAGDAANAFADEVLSAERRTIGRNGFSLFYTPTYVVDGTGVWLTSEQKRSSQPANCPRTFAQLLANTESKPAGAAGKDRYKWYIVGHGAKVFQQALQEYKRLSKHPLSRSHDFYFVDPQVPLGLLQQDLRDNGIDFYHDKNILTSTLTAASKMHQLVDPAQTFCNMHRAWGLDKIVRASVKEAGEIYKTRGSQNIYFSDIVKKLSSALNQRWG